MSDVSPEICLNDGTPLDEHPTEPGLFVCSECGVAFPLAYLIARRELPDLVPRGRGVRSPIEAVRLAMIEDDLNGTQRCRVCWEDVDLDSGPCGAWANCPFAAEEDQ